MSNNPEIGIAAMYRIIKKSGAERIGDDAADELRRTLEELGVKIAKYAVELSSHAGRRTVRSEDIKLASKYILNL